MLFPMALFIGMNSDDFWNGPPRLFNSYMKAKEMQDESKTKELDTLAWLIGLYDYQAFSIVLSQAFSKHKTGNKYPSKPNTFNTSLSPTNRAKKEEDEMLKTYAGFMALTNAINRTKNKKTV